MHNSLPDPRSHNPGKIRYYPYSSASLLSPSPGLQGTSLKYLAAGLVLYGGRIPLKPATEEKSIPCCFTVSSDFPFSSQDRENFWGITLRLGWPFRTWPDKEGLDRRSPRYRLPDQLHTPPWLWYKTLATWITMVCQIIFP